MDRDKDGFVVASEYQAPEDGVTYSTSPRAAPRSPKPADGTTWIRSAKSPADILARLDTDGDRRLSFEEYRMMRTGAAMAIIRRGDRDGDRRLTQAEYVEGSSLPDAALARLKAKSPGLDVVIAQMRKKSGVRFARLDANHDGALTSEEMTPS